MNEAYLFEKTRGLIKYLGQMRVLGLIFGNLVSPKNLEKELICIGIKKHHNQNHKNCLKSKKVQIFR